MKKLCYLFLLVTIFVLGCGSASSPRNASNPRITSSPSNNIASKSTSIPKSTSTPSNNNSPKSISTPHNTDNNHNGAQEVRSGTYRMMTGNHSILYLYNDGIAGYMNVSEQSSLPTYNYVVKNEKVILTNDENNDEFKVFDITEDGNLKVGDDVYYYTGKDEIGNGNYKDRDPSDSMDGGDPTPEPSKSGVE